MSFLKKLFNKKETENLKPISNYQDFWDWFLLNEKNFYSAVKTNNSKTITNSFFNKLRPKLDKLKNDIWYLTGMLNKNIAELILTADGSVEKFYLIEELIRSAPKLNNWKFTAHKPENDIENVGISMAGYTFSSENLFFYSNDLEEYPDEIDITIIHDSYNEDNQSDIINGSYIFIDNFLGELNSLTLIDAISFKKKSEAEKELIPISKLKTFIIWREKEFIEKYEGKRRNTENDSYSSIEATLKNGKKLIGIFNTDLLKWDSKASHPWILKFEIKYNGDKNGFPNEKTYNLLDKIENEINSELKDFDGYLSVGRETADNVRDLYFACKEFRKPSKTADNIISKYENEIEINYEIYKDKYWRSFNRFKI